MSGQSTKLRPSAPVLLLCLLWSIGGVWSCNSRRPAPSTEQDHGAVMEKTKPDPKAKPPHPFGVQARESGKSSEGASKLAGAEQRPFWAPAPRKKRLFEAEKKPPSVKELTQAGRLQEAAQKLKKKINQQDTDKHRSPLLLQLARIRISQRKHQTAAALAVRFSKHNRKNARAHAIAARAYYLLRKNGKALRHAQKAAALAPRQARWQRLLGEVLLQRKKPQAAIKALEKALRLQPKSAWTHNLLADALWASNRRNKAATHYRKAAQLSTDGPVWQAAALDKLGTLYLDNRSRKKAVSVLTECKKRFPKMGCPYTEAALSPADPTRPHRRETHVMPRKYKKYNK